jgi:aryl-alcohol dehydrogenase-like predicted oxidoreductase
VEWRVLGTVGPVVSAVGLGCMGMSDFYGERDEKEAIDTIHRALEIGVTLLDTSDAYGPHTNEVLVGKALKGRHDQVVVSTKFGNMRSPTGEWLGINGRPAYVREACDASLKRLQRDHIDLYYQHRVDRSVPIEDTVGAMGRLAEEGKIRYLGLSEASVATLRRAQHVYPISALQTEYSLWTRDPEDEILPACRELGIGFVAYSPLGRGFLSGRFRTPGDIPEGDVRRNHPRFQGENFRKNLRLVDEVRRIAAAKKCTPAQLALAWLLTRGRDIVPIPGTKHRALLEENAAAVDVPLTDSDLAQLEAAAPKGVAAGERYPEGGMRLVNA